jgi:hypothetical protein
MDYTWLAAIIGLGVITSALMIALPLGMWLPGKKES